MTFLCGSEEELRRVTRWMCQAAPSLFQQECVIVHCCAADAGKKEYFYFSGDFQHRLLAKEKTYLCRGCTLILQQNRFTGTMWLRDLSTERPLPKTLFGFFEWPLMITMTVVQPSLEEQITARLAFADWLDNKVGEEERCKLLGLCD